MQLEQFNEKKSGSHEQLLSKRVYTSEVVFADLCYVIPNRGKWIERLCLESGMARKWDGPKMLLLHPTRNRTVDTVGSISPSFLAASQNSCIEHRHENQGLGG
jgi:hypothetical protein